jgi:hypothetical protein
VAGRRAAAARLGREGASKGGRPTSDLRRLRPRAPPAHRPPGLLIIADKAHVSHELDRFLHERGVPADPALLKSIRRLIESVNDTVKGRLNLEQRGGRTVEGVGVRIAQRLPALTAATRHNRVTGQPVTRSLTAYDR